MNLVAVRLDNGRSIELARLPASWYREEYDRHAWFESQPRTAARRLADALIFHDLAVLEPAGGWVYRYEQSVPWRSIALGCEYHDGRGWKKKCEDKPTRGVPNGYLIRY